MADMETDRALRDHHPESVPITYHAHDAVMAQVVGLTEAPRIGLNLPLDVRGVAGAGAAESIAIATPCHRVVRSDGDLVGLCPASERKRALLEREADASSAAIRRSRRPRRDVTGKQRGGNFS